MRRARRASFGRAVALYDAMCFVYAMRGSLGIFLWSLGVFCLSRKGAGCMIEGAWSIGVFREMIWRWVAGIESFYYSEY